MHELSLCQGVVRLIEDEAKREAFGRVRRVRLEIGALAGVELEAMRMGFQAASRDTVAAGAELVILIVPGKGYCTTCKATVSVSERYDPCPSCGKFGLRLTEGAEMRIKDLEVE